jgi:hypothetical protein
MAKRGEGEPKRPLFTASIAAILTAGLVFAFAQTAQAAGCCGGGGPPRPPMSGGPPSSMRPPMIPRVPRLNVPNIRDVMGPKGPPTLPPPVIVPTPEIAFDVPEWAKPKYTTKTEVSERGTRKITYLNPDGSEAFTRFIFPNDITYSNDPEFHEAARHRRDAVVNGNWAKVAKGAEFVGDIASIGLVVVGVPPIKAIVVAGVKGTIKGGGDEYNRQIGVTGKDKAWPLDAPRPLDPGKIVSEALIEGGTDAAAEGIVGKVLGTFEDAGKVMIKEAKAATKAAEKKIAKYTAQAGKKGLSRAGKRSAARHIKTGTRELGNAARSENIGRVVDQVVRHTSEFIENRTADVGKAGARSIKPGPASGQRSGQGSGSPPNVLSTVPFGGGL